MRTHRHGMFCSVFGCTHADSIGKFEPFPSLWESGPAPRGCVCPAGAEKTCKGDHCPRQPLKPLKASA